MNDPKARKRLIWAGSAAVGLVVILLFVSLLAPSPQPGSIPEVRVGTTVPGAAPTSVAVAPETSGFSLGGAELVSLAWRLGLVVVIIAVSIVGLRWWGKKTAGPRSVTGFLRIVDTLSISNGRTIHLVALGDRAIAVGATAQQLSLLNELTEDEATRVLTEQPRASEQPVIAFANELFQSMRRGQRPEAPDIPAIITRERS